MNGSLSESSDYSRSDVTYGRDVTKMACNPDKVICLGEGLHFGYFRHPVTATVDTRNAGPGELTVYCDGPENKAFCELSDHKDGTFTLTVRPQDVGPHSLHILYNDIHVPGSPYNLRVSPASLVEVAGRGLSNNIMSPEANYEFMLNTFNAGHGTVKIRVGGPTGAFHVQTKKEGNILRCRYNPKVPGLYEIQIFWSGDHIPGSPFSVFLARNEAELWRYTSRDTYA